MITGIEGISSRIEAIYDRIEEIQSYGSLGLDEEDTTATEDIVEVTDSEQTFSEILDKVMSGEDVDAESMEDIAIDEVDEALNLAQDKVSILEEMYSELSDSDSEVNLDEIITKASETYGIDESLIKAIIKTESAFDSDAVSTAGAQGLMQLMPQTAELLGVEDSFDVTENVFGGVKYLSMLLEKYDNNTVKALAAYNAGPDAVDAADGVPNYSETKGYVLKVLQNYEDYMALNL